ncbi:CgeB family protein [Alkalihalobacterium chitinilyticum]|uniref:Glycosyltransferase n=1 Tax=Alkalihalobacterium chitinilyticum TaxID=2980103 RepID=A0ABT5VB39_9BACI|nr:glycosyltransferase [Alkalihalobacterium chitinilyticum]MDE5412683.1 glycosyltransferase [Alkalihalobacterium chitinilyticum]
MKILYIPTVNNSLYHYFDHAIIDGLLQLNHGVRTCSDYTNIDTLNTLVSSFQPDIILTMARFNIRNSFLNWIKEQKCTTAIWLTEDPYYTDKTIKIIHYFKYIFTIESSCVPLYKKYGHHNVYYLPLGTDPVIYSPPQTNQKYKYDISLVGFPYPERIKTIKFLLDHTSYSILTAGNTWLQSLGDYKTTHNYNVIDYWIEPCTVASIYNQSKIILNTHRSSKFKYNRNNQGVYNQSLNNRTFDIAGCRAFQLIDNKPDLGKHFVEGDEIIAFEDCTDLLQKIDYYLINEEERNRIASNARNRVIKSETFLHRLSNILGIIQDH